MDDLPLPDDIQRIPQRIQRSFRILVQRDEVCPKRAAFVEDLLARRAARNRIDCTDEQADRRKEDA